MTALQVITYSLLLSNLSLINYAHAGPAGGNIVGGAGSINQSGLNTTINQNSSLLSINWNSFNINRDERVQFIQPNIRSIALNRILSNNASQIHGRIDANGQVILVNPNGIFFSPTAMVNVGGLIASGLDIKPSDFMNGNFLFKEVLGTEGTVINSGTINASLGGNVALLGKQVSNEGIIVANLGSVSLAAGKEVIVTFDNGGLLGVKITKEILQNELGVDPAVLNSGEITAEGGRILMTGSVSQDIFSQAVNTGDIEQATSVVVHADGTFTLGGGADVVNTGTMDVSHATDAGEVVMLGENVTSSGNILADSVNGAGGHIELHANDITEITGNGVVSAQATNSGTGGTIKLLGDKVGLFDNALVDASGANGGGEIYIGGGRQGLNTNLRNANYIYLGKNTQVNANATDNGDGGKIITFAEDTARIYGWLEARGGINGGNGGFIETSGKQSFEILNAPDVGAVLGEGGLWLIDPFNITIQSGGDPLTYSEVGAGPTVYTSTQDTATIDVGIIEGALVNGDVTIFTDASDGGLQNGDIVFDAILNYDGTGNNSFTLNAAGNISFGLGSAIQDSNNAGDSLNVNLYAVGDILINNFAIINTQGGNFTVGFIDPILPDIIPTRFTNNGTVNTSGADATDVFGANITDAGDITITTRGAVISTGLTAIGGANLASDSTDGSDVNGRAGGNITLNAASVAISGTIDTRGSAGRYDIDGGGNNGTNGGNGGFVDITATTGNINVAAINTSGGLAAGDYSGARDTGDGGDAGTLDLNAAGASTITLNNNLTAAGARGYLEGANGSHGDGAAITLNGAVVLAGNITIDASGAVDTTEPTPGLDGKVDFTNTLTGTTARNQALTIIAGDIDFAGAVGAIRLGDINLSATGDINAAGNNLTARSFDVTQSNSFISNNINTDGTNSNGGAVSIIATTSVSTGSISTLGNGITSGGAGRNGGDIDIDGASIAVGSLTTRGSNAGGTNQSGGDGGNVTLTAIKNAGVQSITLNGNIDTRAGVSSGTGAVGAVGAADLILSNAGSPGGNVFINHLTNFTSNVRIIGSTGTDTLTGANRTNAWQITTTTAGTLNSNISFTDFENLNGGSAGDTFTFSAGANITGLLDARGGTDRLNITALSTDITVELGANVTTNLNVDQFETINANADPTRINTLLADDIANTWNITGNDTGDLNGMTFTNFANVQGGSNDDVFTVGALGNISGQIDGGLQATVDSLDLSSQTSVDITVGGALSGVQNVEQVIGNNTDSTLSADNALANTWEITGINSGTVNGTLAFTGFNFLEGGALSDTFNITADGSIGTDIMGTLVGNINAMDGDDILNVTLSGTETGQVTFIGGAGTGDRVTLTGGAAGYTGVYSSDVLGNEQFIYSNAGNNYTINYSETEIVQDNLTATSLTVNGAAAGGSIGLGADNFTVNAATTVDYSGKNTLIVDASAGTSTIDFTGGVNVANLRLISAAVTYNTTARINATTLTLDQISSAGSAGSRILTNVTDVAVVNSGDVFIDEQNQINLSQLNGSTGVLDLIAQAGDITDSSALISADAINLNAMAGAINLDNNNQLSGAITLRSTGATALVNTVATNLAGVTAQNLTLSGGALTQTGAITVANLTSINAAGQNITLLDAGNNFNLLTLTAANDVNLNDRNAIDLGAITAAGDITLTASGAANINDLITSSGGAVNITGQTVTQIASNLNGNTGVSLTATGGDVTINTLNVSNGTVSLTAAGEIIDTNAGAVNLVADRVVIRAVTGVGNADAIETQTANLDVINTTSGTVSLNNTGVVTLTALQNNGDITLINDTDIHFIPGSVDANYNLGDLFMSSTRGSFLGVGPTPGFDNPDITARNATFLGLAGNFGSISRPLVLNVRDSALISTRASLNPLFADPRPTIDDQSFLQLSLFDAISAISGEQLVQVEEVSEVDPAIFTEVTNYDHEEIAIRLPRDQMFEDELEEDKKAQ